MIQKLIAQNKLKCDKKCILKNLLFIYIKIIYLNL